MLKFVLALLFFLQLNQINPAWAHSDSINGNVRVLVSHSNQYMVEGSLEPKPNASPRPFGEIELDPTGFQSLNFEKYKELRFFKRASQSGSSSRNRIPLTLQGMPLAGPFSHVSFSPREDYAAFVRFINNQLELWSVNLTNGRTMRRSYGLTLVSGPPYIWSCDGQTVLARNANTNGLVHTSSRKRQHQRDESSSTEIYGTSSLTRVPISYVAGERLFLTGGNYRRVFRISQQNQNCAWLIEDENLDEATENENGGSIFTLFDQEGNMEWSMPAEQLLKKVGIQTEIENDVFL
jgi:hypothetical protein